MDKIIIMLKLIYRSTQTHKRIKKLIKIQFKLLDEMKLQLELQEKDKDLYVGTHLFQSTDYISQYIETLQKNIDIMEAKMKSLIDKK